MSSRAEPGRSSSQDLGDLSDLDDDVCSALLANARTKDLEANAVIYFQEDATEYLYILLSGHIRLTYIGEDGFVTLYNIISAGRSFGESGLLDNLPHCDTASTIGPARVMGIDASWIRQDGAAQAAVRQALAQLVAQRYRQHMQFTRALYFPSLSQRLAYLLGGLLDAMGNDLAYRGSRVLCLGPEVTQRDLGVMARGTRENVNKTLRRWQKDGILALEDRHIIVLDRDRLDNLAINLD
ncbi:Crp/Fnr family transcriptional regulator [Marivita sp. S0852]|uniref:Crp/Fnr family transcriptional regulator n=1 Tax=Marivita sp. S0852 TaxID=3373893 RepID=UPI0039829AAC